MDERPAEERGRIEVPAKEARGATREGVVRYVLAISLAAIAIAFAILWWVNF
ncbi:MAG TPA: hypothetical protein VFA50_05970 [Stellaceae bacterium]|nr:hypothetical protein [Stellaceae bacterium]